MATRFTFTIRDWFWFSLVLCLAIGWGGHFRYSWWLERNVLSQQPEIQNEEQLRKMLSDTADEAERLRIENIVIEGGLRQMLSKEQMKEFEMHKEQYRQ